MNDAEIMKALECCSKPYCNNNNCPLHRNTINTKDCITQLSTNALDLINRQKAEIERLNKKAERVFEATINKVLSIKDHYVIVDDKFVGCEMMEELESLFGMEFCEFNDDYEKNLDNLLKEMAGDTE